MARGEAKLHMRRYPITIVESDPTWPVVFEQVAAHLRAIHDGFSRIEHVGSTAVPGLAAKPIIDVMPAVPTVDRLDVCVQPLLSAGYRYVPEHEAVFPDRRFFALGPRGNASQHIHVVVEGSGFWLSHLAFRDKLHADPDLASAYSYLKRRLATEHGDDREAYTDAKSAFIAAALAS
jgi:GrpB-like predicted nucleotidyltransferase (UPF0157 family)